MSTIKQALKESDRTSRSSFTINIDHNGNIGNEYLIAERIADAVNDQIKNYGITHEKSNGMIKSFSVSKDGVELTNRKIY